MGMRILVVSRLYPLPENPGRGIFVQDHVHLLKSLGHEVEVLHVLPQCSNSKRAEGLRWKAFLPHLNHMKYMAKKY